MKDKKPPFQVIDGGKSPVTNKRTGLPNGGGGGPRNEYGLTRKEEAYARLMATDSTTSTEAYRQVYDVGASTKIETVHQMAFKVGNREKVRKRIAMLRQQGQARSLHDPGSTRTFIIERLWEEAKNMQNRTSDRLKAIELLGKLEHVGAFRERSEVLTRQLNTPEEIKARIEELLGKAG